MYHRYYFNGSWSAWRRHLNADELPKDYIVEQGVSGDWYYDKYASGKIEITNSSAWAFTSGYTYITPPDVCEFIRTKPTIIIATGRYRGDNRTPGLVFTPSEPATKSFSMYGRNGTIAVTGTHYVDLVIKGFWK